MMQQCRLCLSGSWSFIIIIIESRAVFVPLLSYFGSISRFNGSSLAPPALRRVAYSLTSWGPGGQ